MANNFYQQSGYPAYSAAGDSQSARSEFASIEAGFNKLPTLTANGLKVIRVNSAGSILEAVTLDSALVPIVSAGTSVTPADANEIPIVVGTTLSKLTWATLKSTLVTYFAALTSTWALSTTGNAATSSACSGNAASATTAAACSGNAASATTAGACSGNAASATVLATGRSIYGNSFDGSVDLAQVIGGTYGGTGVNNATRTITYAGNVAFTGAFNPTFVIPGTYTYTLPPATSTLLATNGSASALTSFPTLNQNTSGSSGSCTGNSASATNQSGGSINATSAVIAGAAVGTPSALTSSGASIAINLATACNFTHTTSENTTLAAPSNPVAGQSGIIVITQGATARTLAFNTFWKFAGGTIPTLTATIGAVDIFAYYVESGSRATCSLIGDVK